MAFHDIRFPLDISLASEGGPVRRTDIVTLASGHERRNARWAGSRRRYNAGYGIKSLAGMEAVIAFFEARGGPLHAFRWRDPLDWKSCPAGAAPQPGDEVLGLGDGAATAFQLAKTYASGAQSHLRIIAKPVAGTVRVALDGAEQAPGGDFTVDPLTGIVTLTAAPAPGVAVSAGYEFDVPVRFDTDSLSISLAALQAGDIPSIPLIEVLS